MPVLELVLADGPQDQAHAAHRHPEPHRHRVQQQEARAAAEEEGEVAGVQLRQPGQEVLLAQHQQPLAAQLRQLPAGAQPRGLAGDLRVRGGAEPHRQLLAHLPDQGQHRHLPPPLLDQPVQQQHPLEAHPLRAQFSIATLRMTQLIYHNVTPSISHRRRAASTRIAACRPASAGTSGSRTPRPSARSKSTLSASRTVSRKSAWTARFRRLLWSGRPRGTAGISRGRRRSLQRARSDLITWPVPCGTVSSRSPC